MRYWADACIGFGVASMDMVYGRLGPGARVVRWRRKMVSLARWPLETMARTVDP
jgi:hypothetical protein